MKKSQTFSSPLTGEGKGEGENILTPHTLILLHKGGGNFLVCLSLNSKGISVLFLIITLLLMVSVGYILSYLIPTKQKSVEFPIYSTQAYYIAQSGIEYGIRYCSDQGWRGTTDTGIYDLTHLNDVGVNQRSIVIGKVNERFTINYASATDTLTSTGEIIGSGERRVVSVSRFIDFLRLAFVTSAPYRPPYWSTPTSRARFYIRNVRTTDVVLNSFSASWTQNNPQRTISRIYIGGTLKYSGAYVNGSGTANFNRPFFGPYTYTLTPGTVYLVEIRWSGNVTNGRNIIITFYTAAGDGYTFNLDPEGNGL